MQFIENLKVFIKLHLAPHFGLYLKKESTFSKKKFHFFIDLGLLFDLYENESYSTFVTKAGFFTRKNLSNKPRIFLQAENVG